MYQPFSCLKKHALVDDEAKNVQIIVVALVSSLVSTVGDAKLSVVFVLDSCRRVDQHSLLDEHARHIQMNSSCFYLIFFLQHTLTAISYNKYHENHETHE